MCEPDEGGPKYPKMLYSLPMHCGLLDTPLPDACGAEVDIPGCAPPPPSPESFHPFASREIDW